MSVVGPTNRRRTTTYFFSEYQDLIKFKHRYVLLLIGEASKKVFLQGCHKSCNSNPYSI